MNTLGEQVRVEPVSSDALSFFLTLVLSDVALHAAPTCDSTATTYSCQSECRSLHRKRSAPRSIDSFPSWAGAGCESSSVHLLLLCFAFGDGRRNCPDWFYVRCVRVQNMFVAIPPSLLLFTHDIVRKRIFLVYRYVADNHPEFMEKLKLYGGAYSKCVR